MEDQPAMDITATTPAARVLIIDDEPQIRRFVDISLRSQGYATLLAETGLQGLTILASKSADIVILDLGLPDQDGRKVLAELRQWTQLPVIVLTVRSSEEEKVALLDIGANDYMTKPFGVGELMARIRALLRNVISSHDSMLAYDDGSLKVDISRRIVILDGEPVTLTRKEFALLALLVRRPDHLVTQTMLLREMWGPNHADDSHYLRGVVAKLRVKLKEEASAPRYIITEPGVGLRFVSQRRNSKIS